MQADEALLGYIKSVDTSLKSLDQSYKDLNDKVDEHINNDNSRIGVLEKAAAVDEGVKASELKVTLKKERRTNAIISTLFAAAVVLIGAYMDRR